MRFILVLSLLFAVAFAAPVAENEVNPDIDEGVGDPATPKTAPVTEVSPADASPSETATMEATTASAADDMTTKEESKDETPMGKAPSDDASDVKPADPEMKGNDEEKPAMPDEAGKDKEMKPETEPKIEEPEKKPDMNPDVNPEMKPEEQPNKEDGKDENKGDNPNEDKNDDNDGFTIYAVIQPPVYRYNPFYNTYPNYPGANFGPYYPTFHRNFPTFNRNIPTVNTNYGTTYGTQNGYGGYRVVLVPQTIGYNRYY